ncbi:hypothetical protein Tco_1209671 [Tanacetum coccineum]
MNSLVHSYQLPALRCSVMKHDMSLMNLNAYEVLNDSYTSSGNPVKEILLKLNLPDHRLILTDSKYEYISERIFKEVFHHSDTERLLEVTKDYSLKKTQESCNIKAFQDKISRKDPALMRSGKLHYKIEFPYPTEEAKARILQDVFTEVIYDRRRWAPKNQGSTDPTNAEDYNNWPEDTLVRAV